MANERNGRLGGKDPGTPDERERVTGREPVEEPLALSRRTEGPARSHPTPPLRYGTLFGGALPSREKILSVASLLALAAGILLLALTAPWSPLTGQARAQVSGDAGGEVAQSSGSFDSTMGSTTESTTGTGGGSTERESEGESEGGFAPSVLPEDAPAVEPESEASGEAEEAAAEETPDETSGALPEASPGGSAADERYGETTELTQAPGEAAASTCTEYATQEEAQAALDAGEYGLDEDGDGAACEAYFGTGTYDVSPAGLETGGMPSAAGWAKLAGIALTVAGVGGLGLVVASRLFGGRRVS